MPWSHHHQSDGISENILSESAQIRSALQSKTYLQALSPDERRRLLKGTKVLGHRRKQHTSAVAAATARRDELQQLLDQDKDDFIDSQTVLAQQPDVSYSSKPAAHETAAWETARLRVRATSMAAENDALKNHVAQLMHQISNMDRSVQVVSNEARARSQRMTEAAAARIAELEHQVERQQRALSEMSVASEEVARDNCAVSDELVQLREDKASQAQNLEALQDRVAKLQELYMRDLDQSKALTVHDSIQQSNLLQLATPEMLAVSQPPASFPVPRTAKASCIVPALHEIEALRREKSSLKEQVRSKSEKLARSEEANAELSRQLAAERKAAQQAGAAGQRQLLGSMRRIQYMVSKAKENEAAQQQNDAYIRKLEARLLNQHKAPHEKLKPRSESSKATTGGVRPRSEHTMGPATKQAAKAGGAQQDRTSNTAPASPMFTYHTLSQPLQDASNLPSGRPDTAPSVHEQAPIEGGSSQGHWQDGQGHATWQQGQDQGTWQQGQPSRSSSDCFSMDPAQLEADIAALTSAIAADATSLDDAPHGMSTFPGDTGAGDATHSAPDRPSFKHDLRFQSDSSTLGGSETPVKGSGAQLPPVMNQPLYNRTVQGEGLRRAAGAQGLPPDAERQGLDQEQANVFEHRRSEDEGASGDERPWWHRRQSNEERLANAAEARLLGLAGRPGRGSDHDPPDWHLRRHQPVSYSRPAMQADNSSSSGILNPPQPHAANQEATFRRPELPQPPAREAPAPHASSGSHARGREMLRAALHNLALQDSSPPSSTSCHSAASSSHGALSYSAPLTTTMPNELFDGSTLFNSTASASSMRPAGTEGTAEDRHQSACSTGADPNRRSHQHRPDTAATGANHRDNGGQPDPPRLAVLDPIIQRGLQERQQQHHLDTGQVSKWKPDQMPDQTACQMPGQAPSHMLERQHAQGSTGQSSTPLTGQTEAPVGYASSVSRATPRLVSKAATTRLLQESESSEELLTLEELEERIASLNTTLLRVPSCTQQGSLSHGHERLAAYEQRQMQAAELPSRGVQASRLDGEAYQSSTSTSAITAWQKLTAKHQQPRASNPGLHDAEEDKGDLQSSGSSSPGCTGRLRQAAPLQSPPSTGLRHYSAASKHVSDGWGESDSKVLEWAEACSPGVSGDRREGLATGDQNVQVRVSDSSGVPSTFSQPGSGWPFTMLHSPAAVSSGRQFSQASAKSKQALQAKLSPVAASWRLYDRGGATA